MGDLSFTSGQSFGSDPFVSRVLLFAGVTTIAGSLVLYSHQDSTSVRGKSSGGSAHVTGGAVAPVFPSGGDGSFTVSGQVAQAFYPGETLPVDLVFTNPNQFSIEVTGVAMTVDTNTLSKGGTGVGCSGPTNMVVVKQFTNTVTIPANATWSLYDLGVSDSSWLMIKLLDLPSNQDACKDAVFTIGYTANARSS